jgi:ubiquinone/menaquinone biosynthesis C-methylase UbiE
MNDVPSDPEAAYYDDLDRFVELCSSLTVAGQPYFTVLLCHELYRFLYPAEPYAGFTHRDPVPYLAAHIRRLISFGSAARESVHGYPNLFAGKTLRRENEPRLPVEKETSDLYSDLWLGYDAHVLTEESRQLLARRIPPHVIDEQIVGRTVLDLGCGSGRYAVALASLGAASVTAVDFQAKSYLRAEEFCKRQSLPVRFAEADVLRLPFDDRSFDFVFSNGVLHHTRSWQTALDEYVRVMRRSGFLFLYATGGFFWTTRRALRPLFEAIPRAYTTAVLDLIGMPGNRMIFMDTWYVPIEEHIARVDLESAFDGHNLSFTKLPSHVETDLDYAIAQRIPGAATVWGEGEHRYVLQRQGTPLAPPLSGGSGLRPTE